MSEVSGRIKMQSFADFKNWAWTPTVNEFDRFDGFLKGKAKTAIVEIKDREEKCEKYWSHWIETNKLNNLLELKKYYNCNYAWYINFFGNIMYVYDFNNIKKSDLIYTSKYTPVDNTTNSQYIYKDIVEIPKKFALKFMKINNQWQKIK